MAQDQTQSLIVPQSGFLITQFRPNVPFPRPIGLLDGRHATSWTPLLNQVPSSASLSVHGVDNGNPLSVHLPNEVSVDRDYRVVSYEELEKMLPESKTSNRVEVGLLPTGEAFAPKTAARGEYLLFPSKSSYILYFTHHYFSRENLSRDSTFLRMLVNRLALPLDKLIQAPRLLALKTTVEEVEQALVNSSVVCIDDIGDGQRGVRRIDRFPAEDAWVPYVSPESALNSRFVTPMFHSPSPNDQDDGKSVPPSAAVSEVIGSDVPTDQLALSVTTKDFVSEAPVSSSATAMGGVAPPANSASGPSVVSAPTPQSGRLSTASAASTVSLDRSLGPGWSVQPPNTLVAPNNYSFSVGQPAPLAAYQSNISGAPNYCPHLQSGSLPPDNMPVHALPMRPASCLPQYLLNQGNHPTPALYATGPPMNFSMASATGGQQVTQVMSSPFANAVLAGHHNPLTAFTQNQTHAAWAAAYMAMLQQHQQSAYVHSTVPPNVHASANNIAPAGQTAFPLYYAAQPFHIPSPLSRHPTAQRLSQTPIYPIQAAYAYPSPQATVVHAPIQQHSDMPGHLTKTGGGDTGPASSTLSTSSQGPNNLAYPFLLPQQVQFNQTNPAPPTSNSVAGLAAAAAGLYIQRPAPARTGSVGVSVPSTAPSPSITTSASAKFSFQTTFSADSKVDPYSGVVGDQKPQLDSINDNTGDGMRKVSSDPSTSTTSSSELSGPSTQLRSDKVVCDTSDIGGSIEENTTSRGTVAELPPSTDDKPGQFNSAEDSEDSASSGIGEMNSACSSNTSDAHTTNSSSTLTEQVVGSIHYPHVGRRQYSHPNRFKDASSKT